mmetsp:Transcript_44457/g.123012  ORF Transcript_44457/g.123012 Transcript_44457/m.123012 type:complete len:203 (-) Transcript_44457:185-793(-)
MSLDLVELRVLFLHLAVVVCHVQAESHRVPQKDQDEYNFDRPKGPMHDRNHEEREATNVHDDEAEHQKGEGEIASEHQQSEPTASALNDNRVHGAVQDRHLRFCPHPNRCRVPGVIRSGGRFRVSGRHVIVPIDFVVQSLFCGDGVRYVDVERNLTRLHPSVYHPNILGCHRIIGTVPAQEGVIEVPRREFLAIRQRPIAKR